MEKNQIELMVQEIIQFLKKKQMWKVDVRVYANGQCYSPDGTITSDKEYPGVAKMWFEGPLNYAINHGLKDPQYKILSGLNDIFFKYKHYAEFGNHTTFNIYPDPGAIKDEPNN